MTQAWNEAELVELMEQAFEAGPNSSAEQNLEKFLQEYPEVQDRWQEYQRVRKVLGVLEQSEQASEVTLARIRRAAREKLSQRSQPSRSWRWLLSQPVVAAATILLVIGVGVYSHFWQQDSGKSEELLSPTTEERPAAERDLELQKPTEPAPPTSAPALDKATPRREKKVLELEPSRFEPTRSQGVSAPAVKKAKPKQTPQPSGTRVKSQPMGNVLKEQTPAPREGTADTIKQEEFSDKGQVVQPSQDPTVQTLVKAAKRKIQTKDFEGALKDLRQAQKIQDSPEIQKLIQQCEQALQK